MSLLKSAQRSLSINLEGLREAVVAIGERVATRVRLSKLHWHAEEAEGRLQRAYQELGQALYDTRTATGPSSASTEDLPRLYERIRGEQQILQDLRDRLAAHDDDLLAIPLVRLQEDLKEAGAMVERVTLAPGAPADGKRLGDLGLPQAVRVVVIRREQALLIPSADSLLQAGDEITLLGHRSAVPATVPLFQR